MTTTNERAPTGQAPPPVPGADRAEPTARPDWRTRLRESRFGTVAVLGVTTGVVVAGAVLASGGDDDADAVTEVELAAGPVGAAPRVGEPAPDFTAMTVDGEAVALSDYAGQPVWLVFNATWCSSCRAEAPDVQEAYAGTEGVEVLAVYLSQGSEEVAEYADRVGLTYTHVADPRTEVASAYRVMGIPAHFFVDADGTVRSTAIGSLTRAQMDEALGALTAG